MKIVITLSVLAFIFGISINIPAAFSYLIAGVIFIYGMLAVLMIRYFTAPEPPRKPLPLRIIND